MGLAQQTKLDKTQFKIWKPWLEKQNLPKWAEKLREDTDLKTLLTKDSKEGEEALQAQTLWW